MKDLNMEDLTPPTQEEIDELLKELNRDSSRNSRFRLMNRLISSLLALLIITFIVLITVLLFSNKNLSLDKKYYSKLIKQEIKTVISNDANLDVIKNIYKNRELESPKITDFFDKESDKEKYESDVPLSEVLNNLKTDYYFEKTADTIYLKKLNNIIDIHNSINPFDKLEQNQKNDFENLRFKLGENYKNVSSDINRITDELHNKNQLVTKYLDKSNTSFLISIFALGITIILSFYQIYQNRKERMISIIREILLIDKEPEQKKQSKTNKTKDDKRD